MGSVCLKNGGDQSTHKNNQVRNKIVGEPIAISIPAKLKHKSALSLIKKPFLVRTVVSKKQGQESDLRLIVQQYPEPPRATKSKLSTYKESRNWTQFTPEDRQYSSMDSPDSWKIQGNPRGPQISLIGAVLVFRLYHLPKLVVENSDRSVASEKIVGISDGLNSRAKAQPSSSSRTTMPTWFTEFDLVLRGHSADLDSTSILQLKISKITLTRHELRRLALVSGSC